MSLQSILKKSFIVLASAFTLFALSFNLYASKEEKIPDPNTLVKLGSQIWSHQDKKYIVVNYENYPHWHTYWKNPGDAGLPLNNQLLSVDKLMSPQELEWPTPKLYVEEGGIIAYGYSQQYTLFYEIKSEDFSKIDNKKFTLKSNWLVCKHVCIPGQKTVTGKIQDSKLTSNSEITLTSDELLKRFNNIPQEYTGNELDIVLVKNPDTSESLILYYKLISSDSKNKIQDHALLTPFLKEPFDILKEELRYEKDAIYGKRIVSWDGQYMEPAQKFPANGKFTVPQDLSFLLYHPTSGKSFVVKKSFSEFSLTQAKGFETFFSSIKSTELINKKKIEPAQGKSPDKASKKSFILILLFAFLGGLILNIMPCVLPVISIKLFGLLKSSQSTHKEIAKHNLYYSLGVLCSFWVLAIIILILKSGGDSLGWGFQLQSPLFVLAVILILFIFSLNLFGLFEFRVPGASKLGSIQLKDGPTADFFNGVLATVLSTPCSAPFLGAALTYAFTSEPYITFIIFTAMAIGLSFPFLLIAVFPTTISWLPKPGAWMDHFKKFLALALLLTLVWLYDVFIALTDNMTVLMWLNITMILTFFWIYLSNKVTSKFKIKTLFFLIALAACIQTIKKIDLSQNQVVSTSNTSSSSSDHINLYGLDWKKWSRANMQGLKGNWVFMDFTAKWCFTCKVNEKLVINTDDFRNLVKTKNIKLLLADWTKKNPLITEFLKENGLVGVPAYFVISPKGELYNLGESITLSKIQSYITK